MFDEDDLLPISALQHLLFCERQCSLIHVEGLWNENQLTAEGRHLHERAHSVELETRGTLRTVRGLLLQSRQFGLTGMADVVEFQTTTQEDDTSPLNWPLPSTADSRIDWSGWTVTPVEYKRGRPKTNHSDRVQLCAQALCLEDMLSIEVSSGALFYGQTKRRTHVTFDTELRSITCQAIIRLRQIITNSEIPSATREPKCNGCSLLDLCLPTACSRTQTASQFVEQAFSLHGVRNSN